MNQQTSQYCQKLARDCDLRQLDHVAEWHFVGKRPKDFVRRLLLLDEEQRMTAKDAKKHSWFSNDLHRMAFEEVYHRATKHWKPRTLKIPVVEMIDTDHLKELPMLQKVDLLGHRNNRKRSLVPIDPPYKPYPRRLGLSLLPKRRPNLSGLMSDEVRTAIRENWSPEKRRAQTSDAEEDGVPAFIPDTESDELDRPRDERGPQVTSRKITVQTPRSSSMSPFRPLVRKHSDIVQKVMLKANTASEISTVPRERASSSSNASTESSIGSKSSHSGQAKAPQAPKRHCTIIEGTLPVMDVATFEDRTGYSIGVAVATEGKVAVQQGKEGVTAEKPPDLPVHCISAEVRGIARENPFKVEDCRPKPTMSTTPSPDDSKAQPTFVTQPPAQADSNVAGRQNTQSKLHLPSRKRPNPTPRPPFTMKRRRASIYDIESDAGL